MLSLSVAASVRLLPSFAVCFCSSCGVSVAVSTPGPSPHAAHYGETVGRWNAWDGDGRPFQPSPYGTGGSGPYLDV